MQVETIEDQGLFLIMSKVQGGGASANSEVLKVGDEIRIINYKFPELNPEIAEARSVIMTPGKQGNDVSRDQDSGVVNLDSPKKRQYKYILRGMGYIGMTGIIVEIRDVGECKYELDTGDVAKYVVRITSNFSGWKGKKVTLYPSQVEKISKTNN